MTSKGTWVSETKMELLIHPISPKKWQVVCRPIMEGVIPHEHIHVLGVFIDKLRAVAFAEGRQSATGEPIRMEQ